MKLTIEEMARELAEKEGHPDGVVYWMGFATDPEITSAYKEMERQRMDRVALDILNRIPGATQRLIEEMDVRKNDHGMYVKKETE